MISMEQQPSVNLSSSSEEFDRAIIHLTTEDVDKWSNSGSALINSSTTCHQSDNADQQLLEEIQEKRGSVVQGSDMTTTADGKPSMWAQVGIYTVQ